MNKALFFKKINQETKTVQCFICPHKCVINPGKTGICRIRQNVDGELYSLTYDYVSSVNLDPIEKKPLYHFYPGSKILSVGSLGCNFRCMFCQNWEISQAKFGDIPVQTLESDQVLMLAKENNSIGIAYTYNEPLINYEWVKDTAQLFREKGLKNVLVSNGYINPQPWEELLPLIDAANIDIKSFREDFYKKFCGAKLTPVLESVKMMAEKKKHVEITTLIIPGENDSEKELEDLTDWLAGVDNEIPLHFSRYFPQYKLTLSQTSIKTLEKAYNIARKKLKYVYVGNISESEYAKTVCPVCGNILIERSGYSTKISGLDGAKCAKCGNKIRVVRFNASFP